ncbi:MULTISPECIES: hypothetical protein [Acidobacterium]|uniref:Uncharacterized protein n=1 Tax=Acidobacterium capsulatum (strain ATCC 51196 / DSM 11244 / BCRC 80197 / JCM 7670 / NBRC 15755 / NCIMB 13165 / 161) TaxID=240015 RepID=C1FAG0_ACIC5|nr:MULTISPECIES: hypothetical protein [Acidobacterium]ACO33188.1 hypothetical protein ACP_2359 [Acidobacterium capsulatum ATCC 51196]HCT62394.1 hypothetical protein [Acidobacterium sp.]
MSTSTNLPAMTPTTRRVRAYFAPVNRTLGQPAVFDPSLSAGFPLDAPPSPWTDLGWVEAFSRRSTSKYGVLAAGSPANTQYQVRESLDATVSLRFSSWSKLTMALAAGSQHMNVIAAATPAPGSGNGSGSKGVAAVSLAASGSTATFLAMASTDAAKFTAGSLVAVDVDYSGQTGYVGSGVSAAYVASAAAVNSDPDYTRRVTFNVARVQSVSTTGVTLAQPLMAGVPTAVMKVQPILGFVDREGGSFFQEWSALFVIAGDQGERIFYYYPRLQALGGAEEAATPLTSAAVHVASSKPFASSSATANVANLKNAASAHTTQGASIPSSSSAQMLTPMHVNQSERISLAASFRALPVTDANDGERAVCFRTFVPPAFALI